MSGVGAPPILKLYVHTLFRGSGQPEQLKRNVALLLCLHNKPTTAADLARSLAPVDAETLRATLRADTSEVFSHDASDLVTLHQDALFSAGKEMLRQIIFCVWQPHDPLLWALNETASLIVQSQSLDSPAATLFSISASQAGS